MGNDRADSIALDQYLALHDATLRAFDYFIEHNSIAIQNVTPEILTVRGRLVCVDGLYLQVSIRFDVDGSNHLSAVKYTFHAGLLQHGDRPIFRYDNAHVYTREHHPDAHHKHRFDVITGKEIVPPEWIGEQYQPTLHDVLSELEQWWLDIGQSLKL